MAEPSTPPTAVTTVVIVTGTGSTVVVTRVSTVIASRTSSTAGPSTTLTMTTSQSASSTESSGVPANTDDPSASSSPENGKGYPLGITIGIPLAFVLCVAAVILFRCHRRRAKRRHKTGFQFGATAKYPAPLHQPPIGELEGHHHSTMQCFTKNNLTHDYAKQLPQSETELPAHSPYMHPAELSPEYKIAEPPAREAFEPPATMRNNQQNVTAVSSLQTTSRNESEIPASTRPMSTELEDLLQRHRQLETKKRRMLELQKVEEEQAEIAERIKAISKAEKSL